jgi:hypothetical protein
MSGSDEAAEPESFAPLLDVIRDILLKHEFMGQATAVAELIDLARLESSDFATKLGGGGMWGSAGSVADSVGLQHSPQAVDAEEGSEFVASAFRRGLEGRRSRDREP